jgi:hypothetical protein
MKIRRTIPRRVIIPAIVFPGLAVVGAIVFRAVILAAVVPQPIGMRVILPPQPIVRRQPATLTPARNLVGTWQGQAQYVFHATAVSYCYHTFNVALVVAGQNGNTINGNVTVTWLSSMQVAGAIPCTSRVPATVDAFNGTLSSSGLTIAAGQQGNFSGSITSDTMTLTQPRAAGADGLLSPVHLLRQ